MPDALDPTRFRFAARPRQLNSVNPGEKIIRHGEIRYEMHGIGVAADHVGEMPVQRTQDNLPQRTRRTVDLVSRPSRLRALPANVSRAMPSAASANSAGRFCLMVNG